MDVWCKDGVFVFLIGVKIVEISMMVSVLIAKIMIIGFLAIIMNVLKLYGVIHMFLLSP